MTAVDRWWAFRLRLLLSVSGTLRSLAGPSHRGREATVRAFATVLCAVADERRLVLAESLAEADGRWDAAHDAGDEQGQQSAIVEWCSLLDQAAEAQVAGLVYHLCRTGRATP